MHGKKIGSLFFVLTRKQSIITAIAPNSAAATIVYPIVVAMSRQGSFSLREDVFFSLPFFVCERRKQLLESTA